MPMPKIKDLQAAAASENAARAAANAAERARFEAEAAAAKPKMRRELNTKAAAAVLANRRYGRTKFAVYSFQTIGGPEAQERKRAYIAAWLEVIEAWGKTQLRAGYIVKGSRGSSSPAGFAGSVDVEITWKLA